MKKRILSAFMALALLLTLFPATVTAASGASGESYALNGVSVNGLSVTVDMTAQSDCALFVGLYEKSGKLLDVRTEKITGKSGGQNVSAQFNDDILDGRYAKAFLLNPDTLAPLCEGVDTIFRADEYALIERITIETTADGVTTKTGSALGLAYVNSAFTGANAEQLQRAYNQSKDPVGSSSWDAQAILRLSNGTRRTVTLDDSRNYRTSSDSDAANAAIIADAVQYDGEGYPVDATGARILLTGTSGNDGNWIAEPFTAGHIVRVSSDENGYHLDAVNSANFYTAQDFSLRKRRMLENDLVINNGYSSVTADSETRFVIEDMNAGTYTAYDGVKNAPEVLPYTDDSSGVTQYATAYICHVSGAAKLVFILNARNLSYPNPNPAPKTINDNITFLAAHSTSNLIESDDGAYYEVSAVDQTEVKTVKVKATNPPLSFIANGVAFTPGDSGAYKESACVLLNNVTYDSNDFITAGVWQVSEEATGFFQGIRRVNDEEVRLNTGGSYSILKDVSEGVRVYFVDGSDIRKIAYDEIVNDTQDFVYYVENDGEITYLFIVDYTPRAAAFYNLDVAANVAAGYAVSADATAVTAGQTFTYQVQDNATGMTVTSADVISGLYYTASDGFSHQTHATEENAVWSVTVPSDIKDENTTVYVYVTAK